MLEKDYLPSFTIAELFEHHLRSRYLQSLTDFYRELLVRRAREYFDVRHSDYFCCCKSASCNSEHNCKAYHCLQPSCAHSRRSRQFCPLTFTRSTVEALKCNRRLPRGQAETIHTTLTLLSRRFVASCCVACHYSLLRGSDTVIYRKDYLREKHLTCIYRNAYLFTCAISTLPPRGTNKHEPVLTLSVHIAHALARHASLHIMEFFIAFSSTAT